MNNERKLIFGDLIINITYHYYYFLISQTWRSPCWPLPHYQSISSHLIKGLLSGSCCGKGLFVTKGLYFELYLLQDLF